VHSVHSWLTAVAPYGGPIFGRGSLFHVSWDIYTI
jgi:hypothetical protein